MRHAPRILWLVTLVSCLLSVQLAAGESHPTKVPLAQVSISPTRVEWLPLADHKNLVLTVAGPEDFYLQRELRDGEAPSFSSLDFKDNRLPDGIYTYELRAAGEKVQSGHLWVQEGRFFDKLPADVKPPIRSITAQETITNGDLIVPGQACIGADCASGDANGAALKLQEFGNLQIHFDSMGCCYPSENDWTIQATDAATLSPDFMILDSTAGTTPFRIGAGAPTNAITILNNGNIGVGTLTPAAQLHVRGTDTGFRNRIFVENASATTTPREMLEIRNNGGSVFILKDTSVAQRWAVGTSGSSLVNDNQANAGLEFTLGPTGNLTIAGTLTRSRDQARHRVRETRRDPGQGHDPADHHLEPQDGRSFRTAPGTHGPGLLRRLRPRRGGRPPHRRPGYRGREPGLHPGAQQQGDRRPGRKGHGDRDTAPRELRSRPAAGYAGEARLGPEGRSGIGK